jgi:hypothetical protein
MPRLRLKYEIVQNNRNNADVGIEHIEFSDKIIDIEADRDKTNYDKIKNSNSYYVYPSNNMINVKILATSTDDNFYLILKVWLVQQDGVTVWKNLTPTPIEIDVKANGRADYDNDLKWQ